MSRDELWPDYDVDKLNQVHQALKNSDDLALPQSGVYFDALEARIMGALDAAIDAGEVSEHVPANHVAAQVTPIVTTPHVVAKSLKSRRQNLSARAGQFALLAGIVLLSSGTWVTQPKVQSRTKKQSTAAADQKRATHHAAPQVLTGTVMSFESATDLALEIAARRLVAYHKGE